MTENEMAGRHHRLPELTQTPSCPQSFPASGSFLMSQLFISGGPSTGGVGPEQGCLPYGGMLNSASAWKSESVIKMIARMSQVDQSVQPLKQNLVRTRTQRPHGD